MAAKMGLCSFLHAHTWNSSEQVLTRQTQMLQIPPGFAGQGTAGGSQPNRAALWKRKGSSADHQLQLYGPHKGRNECQNSPCSHSSTWALQLCSLVSLCPTSTPAPQMGNQASSVGNPRIPSTAWEIKTQRKDKLEFCFLNRSLSFFTVL